VTTGSKDDELEQLRAGKRRAVVVLPEGMTANLGQGTRVDLPVYYDAAQQSSRQVILSVLGDVTAELDRCITARPQLVGIRPEEMQAGNKLRDIDYLLPGILAMSLMQLGLFGTMRFVSMRERKVFKRLGATPLPKWTLLVAEVSVRLVMALVQTLLIVLIGQLLFGVKMIGSWPALIGLVLLGAATFVSMGYMVAAFARSEDSAQGLTQAIQFPMMFLSGIFFPVEIMPKFLKPIMSAMPLTYLGDVLRQVMVGAAGAQSISLNLVVLIGTAVITLLVAVRFFRWE
jgi:ABC-2 type transport system permease protein